MKLSLCVLSLACAVSSAFGQSFTAALQAQREADVFHVGDTVETDKGLITFKEDQEVRFGGSTIHLKAGHDYTLPPSHVITIDGQTVRVKKKVYGAVAIDFANWGGSFQTNPGSFTQILQGSTFTGGLGAFDLGTYIGNSGVSVELGGDAFLASGSNEEEVKASVFFPMFKTRVGLEAGYVTNSTHVFNGYDAYLVYDLPNPNNDRLSWRVAGGVFADTSRYNVDHGTYGSLYVTANYALNKHLSLIVDVLQRGIASTSQQINNTQNGLPTYQALRLTAGISYRF